MKEIVNMQFRRRALWLASADHMRAANKLRHGGDSDGAALHELVVAKLQKFMNAPPGQDHHEPGKRPIVS